MGSISMPQGKGSQMHNRRAYPENEWPEHVDQSRTYENVVIRDENLPDAYNRIFGKSVDDYNSKQNRDDRKIPDYLDKIRKSKNGEKVFYEDILQWGKRDDFLADPSLREKAKSALKEYAETFQKRNPNLQLIGAYIHMDEASPHLHFDYIPVASGYKKGMQLRNSLDKALKQQGISPQQMDKAEGRKNNRTMAWKARERAAFAEICRARGLVVDPERESDRPNKSVPEYKAMMDEIAAEKEREQAKMAQELAEEIQRKRQAQVKALAAEKEKAEAEMNWELQAKDAEYAERINAGETILENQRTETEKLRAETEKLKAAQEIAKAEIGIITQARPDMAAYNDCRGFLGSYKIPEDRMRDLVAKAALGDAERAEIRRETQAQADERIDTIIAGMRQMERERDQARADLAREQQNAARWKTKAKDLESFISEIASRGPFAKARDLLQAWQRKFFATKISHDENGRLSTDYLIEAASREREYQDFCRKHNLTKPEEQRSRTRDRSNDLER